MHDTQCAISDEKMKNYTQCTIYIAQCKIYDTETRKQNEQCD